MSPNICAKKPGASHGLTDSGLRLHYYFFLLMSYTANDLCYTEISMETLSIATTPASAETVGAETAGADAAAVAASAGMAAEAVGAGDAPDREEAISENVSAVAFFRSSSCSFAA